MFNHTDIFREERTDNLFRNTICKGIHADEDEINLNSLWAENDKVLFFAFEIY